MKSTYEENKYKLHFSSDDAALDYLASILIEGFLAIEHHEYKSEHN